MVILRTHLRLPRRSLRQAGPFRPGGLIRIAGAACIAAAGSAAVPIPAAAATARVPAVAPPSAWASARPIAVTSLRDSGAGSLRAAIKSANAGSPGKSAVIDFRVGGVITLASRLPAIARKVSIDARSAPAYVSGGPPGKRMTIGCSAALSAPSWLA